LWILISNQPQRRGGDSPLTRSIIESEAKARGVDPSSLTMDEILEDLREQRRHTSGVSPTERYRY
jgi:hypothetical protein